jgi:hypothetical protein
LRQIVEMLVMIRNTEHATLVWTIKDCHYRSK